MVCEVESQPRTRAWLPLDGTVTHRWLVCDVLFCAGGSLAVCCSVLQCVAVCCSVPFCMLVCGSNLNVGLGMFPTIPEQSVLQALLQCTAVYFPNNTCRCHGTLHDIATHNTPQHTATHCSTPQQMILALATQYVPYDSPRCGITQSCLSGINMVLGMAKKEALERETKKRMKEVGEDEHARAKHTRARTHTHTHTHTHTGTHTHTHTHAYTHTHTRTVSLFLSLSFSHTHAHSHTKGSKECIARECFKYSNDSIKSEIDCDRVNAAGADTKKKTFTCSKTKP